MPRFSRGGAPPPPGPRSPILRPKANESWKVVFLSTAWWEIELHWDRHAPPRGRSMPCEKPERCDYCDAQVPKKWRAYAHVVRMLGNRGEEGFLELTPFMCEQIIEQQGMLPDLRGMVYRVERGNGDKARVKMTIQAPWHKQTDLPLAEEKSPELELMRLWGLTRRKPPRNQAG